MATESVTTWPEIYTDFISDEHSELVNRPVTESVTEWDGSNTDVPDNEHLEFADRLVTESVSPRAGIDTDVISDRHSELVYRPVTESVTEWDRSDTDFPNSEHSESVDRWIMESVSLRAEIDTDCISEEHSEIVDRPVTELVTAQDGSNTDFISNENSEFVDQPVTESVTAWVADTEEMLVMNVSTVIIELSALRTMVLGETDTGIIPVYTENDTVERRWSAKVSPGAHVQVVRSDNQRNSMNCCFGVCEMADSVDRSETGSYWSWACWMVWDYHVSCLAAIVIKDWLHGIDPYIEDSRVCTSRHGIVGNPMTLCDVISVYTKMKENHKGDIDNVMLRYNDPVYSCCHQRCVDNRHWLWTHASVREKLIREKGRFGCVDIPVRNADWSVE